MTAMPAAPRPRSRPAPRPAARKAPWGWLELIGVAQYAMPALLFLPFITGPLRTSTRVLGYGMALLAWAAISQAPRRAVGRPIPARSWLGLVAVWLGLSIFHPLSNSLMAAVAEAGLAVAILSPVFWVSATDVTTRRVGRLLTLIFLVCSASTLVGIAQFYYPGRFDPPNMLMQQLSTEVFGSLTYETDDGRQVLRPCGLTDTPGGAAAAGSVVFLLGLGLALSPDRRPIWRLSCLPLAAAGMAVMYFSQVRQMLIVSVLAAVGMAILFALRGDARRATTLATAGGVIFALALLWALRAGGDAVLDRFRALFEGESLASTYYSNRGHFVTEALTGLLPSYPIGAGLGRWGMTNHYFGIPMPYGVPGGTLWCEEQFSAWVVQGGVVILVLYLGALVVTLADLVRIVRTTPDPTLAVYATATTALCAATLTTIFGFIPFMSPLGLTFWLLAAALHAADAQVRADRRREARQAALARAALGPPAPPPPPRPIGAFPR